MAIYLHHRVSWYGNHGHLSSQRVYAAQDHRVRPAYRVALPRVRAKGEHVVGSERDVHGQLARKARRNVVGKRNASVYGNAYKEVESNQYCQNHEKDVPGAVRAPLGPLLIDRLLGVAILLWISLLAVRLLPWVAGPLRCRLTLILGAASFSPADAAEGVSQPRATTHHGAAVPAFGLSLASPLSRRIASRVIVVVGVRTVIAAAVRPVLHHHVLPAGWASARRRGRRARSSRL